MNSYNCNNNKTFLHIAKMIHCDVLIKNIKNKTL